ncbi:MAG: FimV/HubP family polar landmark protein [Pseudomonadota bacterium]
MVRKLAYPLLSLMFVLPSAAYALGMGDIKLRSALNQPFNAEIELLSVSADEAESLKVNLASYETFARVGLDRPAALMFLRFNAEHRDGRHYIKVTSTEPIREPFLSFLVETSWSSGRLLREYTVLIDPPGMGQEEPPAVQAPVVATTPAPAATRTAPTAAAPAIVSGTAPTTAPARVSTLPSGGLSYGPVKADETLWSIASRMRPNKSVTTQQMMMALLKANPEAFYDNNVNRLKMGYVLRIDDPAMIAAMSHAEAVRAISAQNRAWQDQTKRAGAAAGERPTTASTAQASRAVAAPAEPRLKLVAPEGEGKQAGGTAADAAAADNMRKELLLAQETAEAQLRENEQLKKRMQELEGQLSSMQRLLSLKDSDLAAMQQQMGQAPATPAAPAAPAAEPAPAETPAAPVAAAPATEPATVAPAVEEPKPAAPAEEAKPVAEEPKKPAAPAKPKPVAKPVPAAPAAQPSLLDDLLADPLMLGGAGAVVLALLVLVGLMVKRRRAGGPGFSESILTAGGTSLLNSKTTASGAPSEESSLFSDLAVSGMNSLQGGEAEVDPLTEADVYMAYGRYQQAEELLKEALNSHPERHDIKVKLLEVYYSTKDRAAFEPLADEVFNALEGNGPLWGKVLVMGHELCPDNPMFSAAPEAGAGLELGGHDAGGEVLDIGLDLDALAEDMESSAEGGGTAFNLDLGVDFSDLEEEAAAAPAPALTPKKPAAEEPADVVFDLSGLEEEAAAEPAPAPAAEPAAEAAQAEPSMEFDLGDLNFGEAEAEAPAAEAAPAAKKEEHSLDFELGDLGLDMGEEAAAEAPAAEVAMDLGLEAPAAEVDLGLEAPAGEVDLGDLGDLGDLDLGDLDAVGTKLDLAKAYVDMGEPDSARSILNEVLAEGDDKQKAQAQELINQLS